MEGATWIDEDGLDLLRQLCGRVGDGVEASVVVARRNVLRDLVAGGVSVQDVAGRLGMSAAALRRLTAAAPVHVLRR